MATLPARGGAALTFEVTGEAAVRLSRGAPGGQRRLPEARCVAIVPGAGREARRDASRAWGGRRRDHARYASDATGSEARARRVAVRCRESEWRRHSTCRVRDHDPERGEPRRPAGSPRAARPGIPRRAGGSDRAAAAEAGGCAPAADGLRRRTGGGDEGDAPAVPNRGRLQTGAHGPEDDARAAPSRDAHASAGLEDAAA